MPERHPRELDAGHRSSVLDGPHPGHVPGGLVRVVLPSLPCAELRPASLEDKVTTAPERVVTVRATLRSRKSVTSRVDINPRKNTPAVSPGGRSAGGAVLRTRQEEGVVRMGRVKMTRIEGQ